MDIFSYLEGLIGDWFTNFFSGYILNELETMGMPSGGVQTQGGSDAFNGGSFVGGPDLIDFTGGSTGSPFSLVWTRDPFTTVGDPGTNAVDGEDGNPFDAPGPSDTSQLQLASIAPETKPTLVYPMPTLSNSDVPSPYIWDSEPVVIYPATPATSPPAPRLFNALY